MKDKILSIRWHFFDYLVDVIIIRLAKVTDLI